MNNQEQEEQRLLEIDAELKQLETPSNAAEQKKALELEKIKIKKVAIDRKQKESGLKVDNANKVMNTKMGSIEVSIKVYHDPDNPKECEELSFKIDQGTHIDRELHAMASQAIGKLGSFYMNAVKKNKDLFEQKNSAALNEIRNQKNKSA